MTLFSGFKTATILVNEIDFSYDEFKISRPPGDERLRQSIHSAGLLEPPVLFKDNNLYRIIFGHNRLAVLKEMDSAESGSGVFCHIADQPDTDLFIRQASLKNYRGEIGPIGKIRFIRILREKFCSGEKNIISVAKNMQIPDDILNPEQIENILFLPESLKIYLDVKDIGFKIIKKILRLPGDFHILISRWVSESDIRVNIFKSIIDLVSDINKKDKMQPVLAEIDIRLPAASELTKSAVRKDEMLYRELFRRRYPEYTNIKLKADKIINDLVKPGIAIDFPEYFEKNEIGLLFRINKNDNVEGFSNVLAKIDLDSLRKLLELL